MRITYHSWLQNLFITLICVIVGGASVEGPNLSVPNATKVSVVRLMKYILVGDVTEQVYESFALIKLRHQSFSIGPNSRFRQLGVLMDDVERSFSWASISLPPILSSASCASFWSVTSVAEPINPANEPSLLNRGAATSNIQRYTPSCRRRRYSLENPSRCSSAREFAVRTFGKSSG